MRCLDVNGKSVESDNPNRLYWYSYGCTYFTDDWNKVAVANGGIPHCPYCKCPGMQIEASKWNEGAKKWAENNPMYIDFLKEIKEKCVKNISIGKLYDRWVSGQMLLDNAISRFVKRESKN